MGVRGLSSFKSFNTVETKSRESVVTLPFVAQALVEHNAASGNEAMSVVPTVTTQTFAMFATGYVRVFRGPGHRCITPLAIA